MTKTNFIRIDTLKMQAALLGSRSKSGRAADDVKEIEMAGGVPACLERKSEKDIEGTFLVFDMRYPPENLPLKVRERCQSLAQKKQNEDMGKTMSFCP